MRRRYITATTALTATLATVVFSNVDQGVALAQESDFARAVLINGADRLPVTQRTDTAREKRGLGRINEVQVRHPRTKRAARSPSEVFPFEMP